MLLLVVFILIGCKEQPSQPTNMLMQTMSQFDALGSGAIKAEFGVNQSSSGLKFINSTTSTSSPPFKLKWYHLDGSTAPLVILGIGDTDDLFMITLAPGLFCDKKGVTRQQLNEDVNTLLTMQLPSGVHREVDVEKGRIILKGSSTHFVATFKLTGNTPNVTNLIFRSKRIAEAQGIWNQL